MKIEWIAILGLGAALLLLWLLRPMSGDESGIGLSKVPVEAATGMVEWEDDEGNPTMIPEAELPEEIREERKRRKEISESYAAQWKTPITFYGKVVDEKGAGVENAEIKIIVSDTSREGTTHYQLKSDSKGLFTLVNVRGKGLSVYVEHPGYLTSKQSRRNFEYAGGSNPFVPNPQNPEVFRLQKKREPALLVRFSKDLLLPTDGTSIGFSFLTGQKASGSDVDVQFSMKIEDASEGGSPRHTWYLEIEVPEGGLKYTQEEFPTLAPADGYERIFQKKIEKGSKDWKGHFQGTFFVKTRSGDYAVLFARFIAYGDRFVSIQGSLNPDGSPNLQYEPGLIIKTKVNRDGSISLIYPKAHEPKSP